MSQHKNVGSLKIIIFIAFNFFIAFIATTNPVICYGMQFPFGVSILANNQLRHSMDEYIGNNLAANWIYKDTLANQFKSVFTAGAGVPYLHLNANCYVMSGFRYQDATNRGAMVVDLHAHIYLAAIAQTATYWHGKRLGDPAQLRVLVRNPKNLRDLPYIEQWAQAQPDMRGYVLTLYNLNCKARNLEQCKMPLPKMTSPAPAHSAASAVVH